MTPEEILQAVRAELRKELAPVYATIEAITGKPATPPEQQQGSDEPPSIAEAYLKQKQYEEAHHTGRDLGGLVDNSEKFI